MKNSVEIIEPSTPAKTEIAAVPAQAFATMSVEQLRASVDDAKARNTIMKEYVMSQMIEGTDYGVIVGKKKNLLKPGMEKIFSLLGITVNIAQDKEVWEMLGSKPGTVALRCEVFRGDLKLGEGRGVEVVGNKQRDENTTVKIAEKRARIDACLSLGFSDYFTQDMEDIKPEVIRTSAVDRQETRQVAPSRPQQAAQAVFHDGDDIMVNSIAEKWTKTNKPYRVAQTEAGTLYVWDEKIQLQEGQVYKMEVESKGNYDSIKSAHPISQAPLPTNDPNDIPFD